MINAARRRFWTNATVTEAGDGFGILLDTRPVRTPAKAPLAVPSRQLAEAIAAEWRAQEEQISPDLMPMTRFANSAIDKVTPQYTAVVEFLAEYGATDLICYRAGTPAALVARQSRLWDPWLDWSRMRYDAPLVAVVGVMHHPQPAASLGRLRAALCDMSPFELTAVHDLVTLSGSLVLGLAVADGAIAAQDAWPLSRLDEDWSEEQWGRDEEAALASAAKSRDFGDAARFLDLCRG